MELDWSAFETPILPQMFSIIGVTAAVWPAQYCGAFSGLSALCGSFLRMSAWISTSDALSLVATRPRSRWPCDRSSYRSSPGTTRSSRLARARRHAQRRHTKEEPARISRRAAKVLPWPPLLLLLPSRITATLSLIVTLPRRGTTALPVSSAEAQHHKCSMVRVGCESSERYRICPFNAPLAVSESFKSDTSRGLSLPS